MNDSAVQFYTTKQNALRPIFGVGSETVGMQPYSQHVDAPPGKGNDNAAHYIAEVEQPGRQPVSYTHLDVYKRQHW